MTHENLINALEGQEVGHEHLEMDWEKQIIDRTKALSATVVRALVLDLLQQICDRDEEIARIRGLVDDAVEERQAHAPAWKALEDLVS